MKYRPEVDGMRAVAVLAVIIYHFEKSWLPGGFLGVDIFFVISGFLIGSILLPQVHAGDVRIRDYLLRRIRRLLPVFLTVMALTSLATFMLMSPNDLRQFGDYLFFAALGISNIRFIFADSYADMNPATNPILHTWSLGAEEQFYVVALLLALIAGRIGLATSSIRFWIAGATLVSAVTAVITPFWFSEQLNFYWLPSRFWEFGLGIILATLPSGKEIPSRLRQLLFWTGTSLVAFSLFSLGFLAKGPGPETLIPVLGTLMMMYFWGNNGSERFLASRPMLAIGRRSYTLYLVHFPVLALGRSVLPAQSIVLDLGLLLGIALISVLLFKFVESPLRKASSLRPLALVTAPLALSLLGFSISSFVTDGIPQRASGMPRVETSNLPEGANHIASGLKGNPVLLVGDSHMAALGPALVELLAEDEMTIASFHKGACPLLLGVELAHKEKGTIGRGCTAEFQAERLQWINSYGPSTVILFARWEVYFLAENPSTPPSLSQFPYYFRDIGTKTYSPTVAASTVQLSLTETVARLEDAGHQVILVYPAPEPLVDIPNTLLRHYLFSFGSWPPSKAYVIPTSADQRDSALTYRAFSNVGSDRTKTFDPRKVLCKEEGCLTHSDGEIYYRDNNHLSVAGSRLVAPDIVELVRQLGMAHGHPEVARPDK